MKKGTYINTENQYFFHSTGKKIQTRADITPYKDPDWFKNVHKENFQDSFREFRKMYGLSQSELAELVGVSLRAIQNLERPEKNVERSKSKKLQSTDKPDLGILIKCAKIYSSIPTKDGKYYRVSVDNLIGLTPFSSVDNELIHDQLGLNNEAIEALRQYQKKDIEQNRINYAQYEKGEPIDTTTNYTSTINFFLSSKIFREFIEWFYVRTLYWFRVPIYKQKDTYKVFPSYKTEQYDYLYFGCNPDNPKNNIPIRLDKIGNKVIEDLLFDSVKELIKEKIDLIDKESERIRKEIEGDN